MVIFVFNRGKSVYCVTDISLDPELNKTIVMMACGSGEILTLHVQHHTVCDPFTPVGHNACQLLLVGLSARYQHVVAPNGHSSVLVAGLLEGCFALQPGLPSDDAGRLPIGWHAGSNSHLPLLGPGYDGGGCQCHACHRPSWGRGGRSN